MRKIRCGILSAGLLLTAAPLFAGPKTAASRTHRHASVKHASASAKSARGAKHEAAVGMPAERATAIQSALIKQGYLKGEPTGAWDGATVSAMQTMQKDNGWQSKFTPDARALIKLGLGGPGEGEAAPE